MSCYAGTVSFEEKAKENLEACERLLPDDEGRDALCDAAVNRAYFAAYLAVAARVRGEGVPFNDRNDTYYTHDRLPELARRAGVVGADGSDALDYLYGLRIKADYEDTLVTLEEASLAYEHASELVRTVLETRQ
jgi:uncharacterized protein (UPF0332 family)